MSEGLSRSRSRARASAVSVSPRERLLLAAIADRRGIFEPSQTSGSYWVSTTRSFIGMIALSVILMCSGHTSVQHLVMLHMPRPWVACASRLRSLVSSGCMSSSASRMKNRGPANDSLFSSWSRITWQVSWHRKHSMHFRNSWLRSTSTCCIRYSPGASSAGGAKAGTSRAFW